MQEIPSIAGFVPTGQTINRAGRSRTITADSGGERFCSAKRGLMGCVLLVLGFCLLILGQAMPGSQLPADHGSEPSNIAGETSARLAVLLSPQDRL